MDEWYHLPDREEVMVNVSDLEGGELHRLLSKIGEEFMWDCSEFEVAVEEDGTVTSWLMLLGATMKEPV